MNDVQAVKVKVLHGNVHGLGDRRRRGAFEFETKTLFASDNQQVKLCTLMCAPEKTFLALCFHMLHNLIEQKTFPRSTQLGVRFEFHLPIDPEQGVQNTTVRNICLLYTS